MERVGGEHVDVHVLVGSGQNPHSYEPTPGQMSALATARLYFRTGLPFEETVLPKMAGAFKDLEIVDLRQGVPLRKVEAHEVEAGEGGGHPAEAQPGAASTGPDAGERRGANAAEHDHQHVAGGADPHIWLAPRLAQIQARTIADALSRVDPAHAEQYRRNLATFQADLAALDARIAAALAPLKGKEIFVFHPAFGYFADAYGLKQVPVEVEGKEPSAKAVAALVQRARAAGVRVIFVQPQFSTRSAEVIAQEIGGAVVPLDDLPRDYIKSLETMAAQVKQALSPG